MAKRQVVNEVRSEEEREAITAISRAMQAGRPEAGKQQRKMIGVKLPDLAGENPFVALATVGAKGHTPGAYSSKGGRANVTHFRMAVVGGSSGRGFRLQPHEREALGTPCSRALDHVQSALRARYLEEYAPDADGMYHGVDPKTVSREEHRARMMLYARQAIQDALEHGVVIEDAGENTIEVIPFIAAVLSPAVPDSPSWYVRLASAPKRDVKSATAKKCNPLDF